MIRDIVKMCDSKQFGDYIIYNDGRVYSLISDMFLKGDIVQGYKQYTLSINGKHVRFKAHRLVAMLFLKQPNDKSKRIVHHKDGNKLNNKYSNLEWCSYEKNNRHARETKLNDVSKSNTERWENDEFRQRTSQNISQGLINSKATQWKNNGRFRYLIIDDKGNEYSRLQLSKILSLSQSYTDALIKKAAQGKTITHFTKHNISIVDLKEQSQSTIETGR